MKILFFDDGLNDLIKRENNLMLNSLEKAGAEIKLHTLNSSDAYRLKTSHFQVYDEFLNHAEIEKPDIAFIRGLSFPEYLLSELEVRKTEYKISFIFFLREISRSLARSNIMKKLISLPQIIPFQYSLIGQMQDPPTTWIKTGGSKINYKIINEGLNKDLDKFNYDKEKARDYFGIQKDKFVCLFFGRDDFTKGLDVLIDAFRENLNKNYLLYIQTSKSNREETLGFDNVVFNNFFIEEGLVGKLFKACDLVVLPYRKEYEYSSTWVARLSIMAKCPIVVPNITPFNKLINHFKVGVLFDVEDFSSLANSIKEARSNYDKIMNEADFDGYLDICPSWDELGEDIVSEWKKHLDKEDC